MWIKLNNRLINMDNVKDIGLKDCSVTMYFDSDDFWSTKLETPERAIEIFNALRRTTEAIKLD